MVGIQLPEMTLVVMAGIGLGSPYIGYKYLPHNVTIPLDMPWNKGTQ
jgi:hypothetical protein